MAKLTQAQRMALFDSLTLTGRATVTGIDSSGMGPKDKSVLKTIDSAVKHHKSYASHSDTENAVVIPQFIPQTIEESGLVDPTQTPDESQVAALRKLHDSKYCSLIGAAGTGKTTLVKRSIANHIYGGDGFERRGIRTVGTDKLTIAIVAFTGVATNVIKNTMPEWLHPCCMTIHTLLEFKPNDGAAETIDGEKNRNRFIPTRTAQNPLAQNKIYLDEASMTGLNLWHMLLDACRPGTEIVLIGDLNQLTPVADSPFFPAALDAGVNQREGWDVAELTTIHRQKGHGANRIIETAHAVLSGKRPEFDFELNSKGAIVDALGKPIPDAKGNPDWRVINIQVGANTDTAHREIAQWLMRFEKMNIKGEDSKVYKPYEDMVLTAGNGWDPDARGALIQQAPLNATLSDVFTPETEENPTYLIDAGRETRKYTVGDRVMCTKNESPDVKNRVTNGTLGKIVSITKNGNWHGDVRRFGTKKEVDARLRAGFMKEQAAGDHLGIDSGFNDMLENMALNDYSEPLNREDTERQASHIVTVEYQNGETRAYSTAAGVASTQLGYAMTTHKAQGSQAETVFIVCHGAVKGMLNREWLYTGVTRAQKRLVIFSTSQGMRTAIARQQIYGKTLQEKIERYMKNVNMSGQFVNLRPGLF